MKKQFEDTFENEGTWGSMQITLKQYHPNKDLQFALILNLSTFWKEQKIGRQHKGNRPLIPWKILMCFFLPKLFTIRIVPTLYFVGSVKFIWFCCLHHWLFYSSHQNTSSIRPFTVIHLSNFLVGAIL